LLPAKELLPFPARAEKRIPKAGRHAVVAVGLPEVVIVVMLP